MVSHMQVSAWQWKRNKSVKNGKVTRFYKKSGRFTNCQNRIYIDEKIIEFKAQWTG